MNVKARIKSMVPKRLYHLAKRIYSRCYYYSLYRYKSPKKAVYLIGTPDHGNLGDQAIAIAELTLLSAISGGDIDIWEIPQGKFKYHESAIKKHIKKEDVILIHGGGNMGVEWFAVERLTRQIITEFPENKIVIMPQTIFYGESEIGKQELANSIEIYSRHPNLHICAREQTSYEKMRACYPENNIYLVPDMVLYLERNDPQFDRSGIVLCFRRDPEGTLSEENHETLRGMASALDSDVSFTDTVIAEPQVYARREFYFQQKLYQFKRAKLVVTDRLHGMVFCAITGTPCVALSNYNHKVKGVYEWIRQHENIVYADSMADVPTAMDRLYKASEYHTYRYNAAKLAPLYNIIFEIIES